MLGMTKESKDNIKVILAFIGSLSLKDVESLGKEFRGIERAQGTSNMIDKGVNLAVGVLVVGLLAAYLLPIAISEIVSVDTSSWGSAEAALFGLLPIFFVLAILLFVINKAMDS
jgi:hypothetical protein